MVVALGFSISSARSDQYPVLNVAPLCHAPTHRSSLQLGVRDVSFDDCMKAEQNDRQTMINEWSTFFQQTTGGVSEATMGGESSYTDILTCLEMARDVRKLHSRSCQFVPAGSTGTTGASGSSPADAAVVSNHR
jgi:hypothetical protein